MSLQIKPLPEELQKVANAELGEVPERLPEDLLNLKSWIQQQPHLRARLDDQFLVQFLRGCKYSLEKAKQKIDQFYSLRSQHPAMCPVTDVDEPTFRKFHNTGSFVCLPTPLNGNGPRILIIQINFSPQEFTVDDLTHYALSASEVILMNDPYACINGVVFVEDYAKATPNFLLLLTPIFIKNVVKYFENTLPIRIKAIYFINLSANAQKLANFLLQFVPQKLRERTFFYGSNLDELGEKFPQKYLPRDYGGENGSLDDLCAEYNKVWDEHREYFQQNAEYGTDESLRLGNSVGNDGQLGFEGSFRVLNVD